MKFGKMKKWNPEYLEMVSEECGIPMEELENIHYIAKLWFGKAFDNFEGFYEVTLSEEGPIVGVFAGNEQAALDDAINFAIERDMTGLFLDESEIRELEEQGRLKDHLCGGDEKRYLHSLNVTIRKIK